MVGRAWTSIGVRLPLAALAATLAWGSVALAASEEDLATFYKQNGLRLVVASGAGGPWLWRSSRSNPVMTAMTRMRTVTPKVTPRTEIRVMMERKVRFGLW